MLGVPLTGRRQRLVGCLLIAALLAAGSAVAAKQAPPVQVGPTITIRSGSGWSLTGWRTNTKAICLSYAVGKHGGSRFTWKCGFGQGSSSLWTLLAPPDRRQVVVGAIAPNVVRVMMVGVGSPLAPAHLIPAPKALKTRLRFFYASLVPSSPPSWAIRAYDANGREVGAVGKGQLARSRLSAGTVATGMFGTVPWKLSATDAADGSFCLTMTLPPRSGGGSTGCGSIFGANAGAAHGITYLAHTGSPSPDFIVGPVVASARTVVITLSNGTTLQTKTIVPPKDLSAKISFYVTQLPCPASATHLQALDSKGRPVASITIHVFPSHGKTTC